MATIDLSRYSTNFAKHFDSARMQQGRVLTDDDFNEHAQLGAEDMRKTRMHVIGPTGSPDDGFLIESPQLLNGKLTFRIKHGTYYLGGLRLSLESDELYHLQKDWLQQGQNASDRLDPVTTQRFDLVYLECWQQPVSAVEDNELFEVALGGPDTSTRIRTMRRVRVRQGVASADCEQAFASLLGDLAARGQLSDEAELVSDARLKVEPDGMGGTPDLCSPPVAGGYLGAENQAIRVQLVSGTEFTWGFDNGTPLYRVQLTVDSGFRRKIIMLTEPKDQAHWPLSGQVIELLPWSTALVNNQKLAELHGHFAKINVSYNPDTKAFLIDTPPPPAGGSPAHAFGEHWKERDDNTVLDDEGEFFYLRIWNRGSDTGSPARIPIPNTPVKSVVLQNTGLRVTFTGTQFLPDDFWIIAVRPESRNVFVPWDFDPLRPPNGLLPYDGRAPHGVRRWLTPLALIEWTPGAPPIGVVIHDCRELFLPLTRIRNCCTYTVGDGTHSHGHFSKIQTAIDALPPEGGQVCVLPGVFTENIEITDLRDITITGCGVRSLVVGAGPAGALAAIPPVFLVRGGQNIRIDSLAVEAYTTGAGIVLEGINPNFPKDSDVRHPLINVTVAELLVRSTAQSAIRAQFLQQLTIRECFVQMQDAVCLDPAIFALGDDMVIERNVVEVVSRESKTLTVSSRPFAVPSDVLNDPGVVEARDRRIASRTFSSGTAPTFGSGTATVFLPGSRSRGGIQIGGTSDRVRIINNLIRGGSGNGITLGSLIFIDDNDDPVLKRRWPRSRPVDPCEWDKPATSNVEVVEFPFDGGQMRAASQGTLTEVLIERNRIYQMGMNGIGVVAFFPSRAAEFITVEHLSIIGNDIRNCLLRPVAPFSTSNIAGYGGISLADVEHLIIRDNLIADNGPSDIEPVCGIFVFFADGMEVSRNQVRNNGALRTEDSSAQTKIGIRGGIVVLYQIGLASRLASKETMLSSATLGGQSDEPALNVKANLVSVPHGRALLVHAAAGYISVVDNWFNSRGVGRQRDDLLGATVRIQNLSSSNELSQHSLTFSTIAGGTETISDSGWSALRAYLPTGSVLFADNQCVLEVAEIKATGAELSSRDAAYSIYITGLDDIGFYGNQCECRLAENILSNVFLFGFSVRANHNRLKEPLRQVSFSAMTFGFMNTTTENQATHCLFIRGESGYLLDRPNTVLTDRGGKRCKKRNADIKPLTTSFMPRGTIANNLRA